MYNQNMKCAKLAPLGVFRNWLLIWYPDTLFQLNVKKQIPCIFANLTSIFSIIVYNTSCSDMAGEYNGHIIVMI